jgi:hypothetical protein
MDAARMIDDYIMGEGRAEGAATESVLELNRLAYEEPELAWNLVLQILAKRPNEPTLGVLAAGPLEDLIEYHGPRFIERIEDLAKRDANFKHLLDGVWESSTPEVWARVESARGASC